MGCGTSRGGVDPPPKRGFSGGQGTDHNKDEPMTLAEIEDRIECIDKTRTATFGGVKVRYAFLSQRGYYPDDAHKPNQDSYSIAHEFAGKDTDGFFAVYDGHGRDGDKCAKFARDSLPEAVAKNIHRARSREAKKLHNVNDNGGGGGGLNLDGLDASAIELPKDQVQAACRKAHVESNRSMHRSPNLDDSLSGTTSISVYLHGGRNRITVCNVGDSRAVLGQRTRRQSAPAAVMEEDDGSIDGVDDVTSNNNNNRQVPEQATYRALPLSRDQTPYRRDERIRVRKTGARILSLDQIEGLEPIDEDEDDEEVGGGEGDGGELVLGEEIDEGGDPPRVWSPHGEYPGTAFTRSLGDAIAEELGVFAEPEMVTRELGPDDKIIVIASDGVFEFLTNQSVIDICAKFSDPLEACRAVVAESYELWLQYELRTDDITMICIFVDKLDMGLSGMMSSRLLGLSGFNPNEPAAEEEDDEVDAALPAENCRPVRHHVSKEKSRAIEMMKMKMISERDMSDVANEDFDLSTLVTEKSPDEKARISEAIRASVMFQNVTEAQREMIFNVMEPISVKKGDWVIKQGSVGDRFYIVDQGRFEVRIVPEGQEDKDGTGGNAVHVYVGSRENHAHPSFGELALMYSAPRAASIIAQTDGQLWGLHRHAFRKVLAEQNERKEVEKILKKVDGLKTLSEEELQKLAGCMEEATYGRGDTITKQGDTGDIFYIVCHGGHCERVTESEGKETSKTTLKADDFFGEEVLWGASKQYSATVVAMATTTCWKLSRGAVKRTIGSKRIKRRGSDNVA